jgi:hypothetical protein
MLAEPDAEDPLGGVLTVEASGADPIQIVNYVNPYRLGSGAPAARACRAVLASALILELKTPRLSISGEAPCCFSAIHPHS